MNRLILSTFLILLAFVKASAQDNDFSNELNQRAIPLNNGLHLDSNVKQDSRSALFKKLNSFSVLGLGEATHGTHEFFVAKINLIKQLITYDHFNVIGLEAPYAEVEEVNQYILNHTGDLPQILKSLRQYTYETKEFADFIGYIQEHNKNGKTKVLFYGYDFQSPYKALKVLKSSIKNDQHTVSMIDSLEAVFNGLSNAIYSHQFDPETYQNILTISNQVYKALEKVKDPVTAKCLESYKQFMILNNPDVSNGNIELTSQVRDSLMANNVARKIDKDHAVIAWAHNGHVQKSANIFSKSMGQYLSEKLNSKYGAIGLTTYEGYYTAYNNKAKGVVKSNPLIIPVPAQIEYYLKQIKYDNYIFNTDQLRAPATVNSHRFVIYSATTDQFHQGNMIDNFNYIMFLSKTTGSLNTYLKAE